MNIRIIAVILGGFASLATAQTTEKKYEPTEVQTLKLQLKQKDAQLAQVVLQQAQGRFTQALNELTAEAESVKKENQWPADLVFSVATMKFSPKPEPPKKPETPAKK